MLRRMLGVDSWFDVASLENVEEDHSFLFLKKNSMEIFFFLIWKSWIFFKELKILIGDFCFFFKQPKKYEPNALSPKAIFYFYFFFRKIWKSWIFSWNWKFWLVIFFFFLKQPKKYEPNALSPKAIFYFYFLFLFFFSKNLKVLNFFMELKILIDFFFWKI